MCKTYNPIQYALADALADHDDIVEIRCNILLEGVEEGLYTSDFVCRKKGGCWLESVYIENI